MRLVKLRLSFDLGGKVAVLCKESLERRNIFFDAIIHVNLARAIFDRLQKLGVDKRSVRSGEFDKSYVIGGLHDEFEPQATWLGEYIRFDVGELASSLKSFNAVLDFLA